MSDLPDDELFRSPLLTDPDDGAAVLDDVHSFLGRFVAFPSEHAHVAVTLWAAHTHLVGRFESTPRLCLLSPEKQSGKSRTLEVLELLCLGAEVLNDTSAAYMYRRIGQGEVTVLLDECDAIWKRGKSDESAEALRSIVNSGHRSRAKVGRVEMNGKKAELTQFPTYAPVALAGIGNCLPDTVLDRSVIIHMRRRAPSEQIEKFRHRRHAERGDRLGAQLAAWVNSIEDDLHDTWPEMPDGISDRAEDAWEPLLIIADLAGGDWPRAAREACTALVNEARYDAASTGVRLLGHLHAIFGGADAMFTTTILEKLAAIEDAPWATWHGGKPMSARALAKLLWDYRIRPGDVRVDGTVRKGYKREDLWDAWTRYLPRVGATSATSAADTAQPSNDGASGVADTDPYPLHPLHSATENAQESGPVADVADVADTPANGPALPDGFTP